MGLKTAYSYFSQPSFVIPKEKVVDLLKGEIRFIGDKQVYVDYVEIEETVPAKDKLQYDYFFRFHGGNLIEIEGNHAYCKNEKFPVPVFRHRKIKTVHLRTTGKNKFLYDKDDKTTNVEVDIVIAKGKLIEDGKQVGTITYYLDEQ